MKTKTIFKSIGVVLLAFMVCALLSVLTDFLLESIGLLPPPAQGLHDRGLILLVLFYRSVYAVLSGYLLARLSPSKPMVHAVVLGVAAVILTLLATTDPQLREKAPLWYTYTLAALTLPTLWLGVKIRIS